MKYTRKQILSGSVRVSAYMLLASSPLILNLLQKKPSHQNTLKDMLDKSVIPDLIIHNASSSENFDFVALKYERKTDSAPRIAFMNNEICNPVRNKDSKYKYDLLKSYANKNRVVLFDNRLLIRDIKECGSGNEICEDLYRPVSFLYAELYRMNKRPYYDV